jgi:O-antigen/teichoic acid export membrane protein
MSDLPSQARPVVCSTLQCQGGLIAGLQADVPRSYRNLSGGESELMSRGRLILLSSSVGIVQRFAQIVATLVTMPLVLHALGLEGFGIWGAAASLAWMTATVDLGIGYATLTAVARAMAAGDIVEARAQVTASLYVALLLASVGLAGTFAAWRLLPPGVETHAYLLAATALSLNIPCSLAAAIWTALQRTYVVWAWELGQVAVTLAGYLTLAQITSDPLAYVAVTFGTLLAFTLGSLLHLFARRPELRPLGTPPATRLGSVLWRGVPYVFLGLSLTLTIHSDNIIALSMLGPEAAGGMTVAQRCCMTAVGLLWVLTQPLWPAFTDAAVHGDRTWLRSHVLGGAVVTAAAAIGGSALIVMFGQTLLDLWLGTRLYLGPPVLWAMAVWIVIPALGRVPDVLLNALGVVWFQVAVAIVYSALAFTLKLTLALHFGIAGILVATGISYGLTHLPAYLWWVRRWVRRQAGPIDN